MKHRGLKFLFLLLSLALLVGLLSGMSAYAEEYPIWIGNMQVTNDYTSGPTWSYDNSTKTLTLDGFSYTANSDADVGIRSTFTGCIYIGDSSDSITIELKGVNTLTNNITYGCGIFSQSALTFSGSGSLNASGDGDGIFSLSNITVNSGNITATGYTGLESQDGVIEIQGGTVTANGNSAGIQSAKMTGNGIIITGGTVRADGGTRGVGLRTALSSVTIDGGSVTASGQTGILSFFGELQINGGIVIASGSQGAIGCKVKNTIAGTGWTDAAGTGQGTEISTSSTGQELGYKKVQFPAAADSFTVTYAPGEGTYSGGELPSAEAVKQGDIYIHVIQKYEDKFTAPEGKHFDHWDDGKGHTYRYGDTINPVTDNITLTAIWVDNSQGGGSRGGLSTNGADVVFNIPGMDDGWEYIGGGMPQRAYRLSFAPMQGGSAYFLLTSGENGETMNVYPQTTVRVVPTPAPGYRLASIVWSMIDGSASYDITESQTFVMPAMDAVVYVTFQPVA